MRRQKADLDHLHERHVHPSGQALGEYLDAWLQHKREEGLKPKTLYGYAQQIRLCVLPTLAHVPLRDLSPAMLQRWQDALAPRADVHMSSE